MTSGSWSRTTSSGSPTRRARRRPGSRTRCATRCSPAASGSGRCSAWRPAAPSGSSRRSCCPIASSLELIHTYSLIHDDLPAMDDDDLRRGRPTSHVAHGEDVAILAGDALFAEAIRLACEQRGESDNVLAAVREVAAATGVDGMVGGQYLDVIGGGDDPDSLRLLHSLKTGRLIAASVARAPRAGRAPRRGGGAVPALRDRARPAVSDRRRHPRRHRQRRRARQAERLRRAPRQGHLREPLRTRAGKGAGGRVTSKGAQLPRAGGRPGERTAPDRGLHLHAHFLRHARSGWLRGSRRPPRFTDRFNLLAGRDLERATCDNPGGPLTAGRTTHRADERQRPHRHSPPPRPDRWAGRPGGPRRRAAAAARAGDP